jgi:hypothetical protein
MILEEVGGDIVGAIERRGRGFVVVVVDDDDVCDCCCCREDGVVNDCVDAEVSDKNEHEKP